MSSRIYRTDDPKPGVSPVSWRRASGALAHTIQSGGVSHPGADSGAASETDLQRALLQGRSEGEALGVQRAMQRLEPIAAQFNSLIKELASQRRRVRAEAEEDTVKLAIAIARRVLHRELATDPEAILGLVSTAFAKLNAREVHRLRVSPLEAAAIQENRARLEFPVGMEIVSDASFQSGCAVFETSRGDLDASINTQLAEIDRGLTDIVQRRAR